MIQLIEYLIKWLTDWLFKMNNGNEWIENTNVKIKSSEQKEKTREIAAHLNFKFDGLKALEVGQISASLLSGGLKTSTNIIYPKE